MSLIEELKNDIRFVEGIKSCMNCGVCTAICPASEFYEYDPRQIISIVQAGDDEKLTDLLKSDFIWYCGQCMSCKTRCPRGNCPGLIITVLRKLSQEKGFFVESEKGRQQYAIEQIIGNNILTYGYCIYPTSIIPDLHPEQGNVWEWVYKNYKQVYSRFGANLDKEGPGVLRKISSDDLNELASIFEVTGCTIFFKTIEKFSMIKAKEMGFDGEDGKKKYIEFIYSSCNKDHSGNKY